MFAVRCVSSPADIISTQEVGGDPSPATHYRQSGAKDLPAHRPFRTSAGFPFFRGKSRTRVEVKKQITASTDGGKELPAGRNPSRGVLVQFYFILLYVRTALYTIKKSFSQSAFCFDFFGETNSS